LPGLRLYQVRVGEMDIIEQKVEVCLACPFVLRLKDGDYPCKLGKNTFSLKIAASKNDYIDKSETKDNLTNDSSFIIESVTGKITQAIGVSIPGMTSQYSFITIEYFKKILRIVDAQVEQDRDLKRSLKFLNYFIDTYRYVTQDVEVHPLTYKEFTDIRAGQSLSYSVISPQTNTYTSGSIFGAGISTSFLPFGDNEHQQIKQLLSNGTQISTVNLLLLNSKAYLKHFELRLAGIELGSAVDIFVEKMAANIISNNNLGDEFNLEKMNTKPIIEKIINPFVNNTLSDTDSYIQWDNYFRDLRNKVIHDAYEPKQDEVEKAIGIVDTLIEDLSKLSYQMQGNPALF
jgi:hypothetical protein